MKLTVIVLVFLVTISCVDNSVPELKSSSENLIGSWINLEYSDSLFTAQKSSEIDKGQYCFGFEDNQLFLENKNVGWCGTPPIAYGTYTGSWQVEDSIITIETPYWGGTSVYTWKIIELSQNTLKIWIVDQEYLMEE